MTTQVVSNLDPQLNFRTTKEASKENKVFFSDQLRQELQERKESATADEESKFARRKFDSEKVEEELFYLPISFLELIPLETKTDTVFSFKDFYEEEQTLLTEKLSDVLLKESFSEEQFVNIMSSYKEEIVEWTKQYGESLDHTQLQFIEEISEEKKVNELSSFFNFLPPEVKDQLVSAIKKHIGLEQNHISMDENDVGSLEQSTQNSIKYNSVDYGQDANQILSSEENTFMNGNKEEVDSLEFKSQSDLSPTQKETRVITEDIVQFEERIQEVTNENKKEADIIDFKSEDLKTYQIAQSSPKVPSGEDSIVLPIQQTEMIEFIEQLTTQIIQEPDENQMVRSQVHLQPASLGEMTIELNLKNQELIGKIIVNSEETKMLLDKQLSQLAQSLSVNQNLTVQQLEVQVQVPIETEQTNFHFNENASEQENQQSQEQNKEYDQKNRSSKLEQLDDNIQPGFQNFQEAGRLNVIA